MGKFGIIEPYSHIKVDNFMPLKPTSEKSIMELKQTIFILSHMHEDHLRGLTGEAGGSEHSPNISWDYGKIYCTQATFRLMLVRFPNLRPFLYPLEL